MISDLYRSHDISKTEFLLILKNLINNNSKYKNNFIIGNFNFDISNHESINQEFLHILLVHGYCPGFRNIIVISDHLIEITIQEHASHKMLMQRIVLIITNLRLKRN